MTKSIGAFWKKESKAGKVYYSGNIEIAGNKIPLVMFENTRKEKETQPDLQIFISEPRKGTAKIIKEEVGKEAIIKET